jgi:hypothetical protein
VRLRTLSEAECYARCYGGRGEERVSFVRTARASDARPSENAEQVREQIERDLDERERVRGRKAA